MLIRLVASTRKDAKDMATINMSLVAGNSCEEMVIRRIDEDRSLWWLLHDLSTASSVDFSGVTQRESAAMRGSGTNSSWRCAIMCPYAFRLWCRVIGCLFRSHAFTRRNASLDALFRLHAALGLRRCDKVHTPLSCLGL